MLNETQGRELVAHVDAIGNSYAAGEGAGAVSARIEDAKAFALSLVELGAAAGPTAGAAPNSPTGPVVVTAENATIQTPGDDTTI